MNQNYLKSSKVNQFSILNEELNVRGITIHNTNNSLSASELFDEILNSKSNASCHYLVDEKEVIQLVDELHLALHTGKGYDFGNMNTIAIEICRSQSSLELYLKAQERACKLIAQLLKKYNLTVNDIYFHNEFNLRVNCPHRIKELYEDKNEFIEKEVKKWL